MGYKDLYNSIERHLEVRGRVTSKAGSVINVGDRFTVECEIRNGAPSLDEFGEPNIIFVDPDANFFSSQYTRIPAANDDHHLVKDQNKRLQPGDTVAATAEYEATSEFPGVVVPGEVPPERIATVGAEAEVDQSELFADFSVYDNMSTEIWKS